MSFAYSHNKTQSQNTLKTLKCCTKTLLNSVFSQWEYVVERENIANRQKYSVPVHRRGPEGVGSVHCHLTTKASQNVDIKCERGKRRGKRITHSLSLSPYFAKERERCCQCWMNTRKRDRERETVWYIYKVKWKGVRSISSFLLLHASLTLSLSCTKPGCSSLSHSPLCNVVCVIQTKESGRERAMPPPSHY